MSTIEEVEKIQAELKRLSKFQDESDEKKREEMRSKYAELKAKNWRYADSDDEPLDDGTETPPAPEDDGRWQLHKGGNKDPKTWKVVNMTRDPRKFKIVDDKGINIADLYNTKANAQRDIDEAIKNAGGGTVEPQPEPPATPPPTTPTVPPKPVPASGETPYPPKSPKMASTQRGPTTRHYASGKPDDQTIEKNVKEIEFPKYQFVVVVTLQAMEHSDQLSTKLGGTHMGSGWFDNTIETSDGQTCLGFEPSHPSTKLCVVKGPKLGNIVGKKIGMASTYDSTTNKTELWTNFPYGSGWKKQLEGTNVGKFKPDSEVDEAQLRIDGWPKGKQPTIESAFVTAI